MRYIWNCSKSNPQPFQGNDWYEYSDDDFDVEMPIQRDEFLRRLSIASIEVYEEGSITVYYDADEMFTDHAIGRIWWSSIQQRARLASMLVTRRSLLS